jgi:hypothetical protein
MRASGSADLDHSGALRVGGSKEFRIPTKQDRMARRERQAQEMEANQSELRTSIAASKRLVDEADAMIRRHREECAAAESD